MCFFGTEWLWDQVGQKLSSTPVYLPFQKTRLLFAKIITESLLWDSNPTSSSFSSFLFTLVSLDGVSHSPGWSQTQLRINLNS